MKKIILFTSVIALISCSAIKERLAIKECKFNLLSVAARDFTFSNLKLDFNIKVQNPNDIDAVLDKFDYTLYVNNSDVFTGVTGKGIKIPKGKSEEFLTTVTLEYTKIGDVLVEAIRLKKAAYKIKANAYVNTAIGEISYPVEIGIK
jgi:LEA14-like dessication related protein